jgi:hypothetical protein
MLNSTPSAVEYSTTFASSQPLPPSNDAVETVAWLLRWCPDLARALALALHERAAWQYDDGRTEHWRHVLKLLRHSA